MKPCCQLCWRDVIVDADGHAAWCCNACALKLHAVVEAAREFKSVCEDWVQCDDWESYIVLRRALSALDAAKDCAEDEEIVDSAIFADRWRCAWAVVGEAIDNNMTALARVGAALVEARDYGRKMHRRAQEAEGALADLDWALDHFKIAPRGEWKGYGELDLARRIQDSEDQLAEARALLDECGLTITLRSHHTDRELLARIRAWLDANKRTK